MVMAMKSGRRKYGYYDRSSYRPMSDINVTPMVDVMLVLLVIFMVTAPLLTVGVQVDLPKTKVAVIPGQDEPLVISIKADARIFIQETEVELENLVPRLKAITLNKPNTRIFVRGDRAVIYGAVMQVMGTVSSAGFTKVALIAELPELTSKSRRSRRSRKSKSSSKRKRKK